MPERALWTRLADRCVPASALCWGRLDGYLPPAPAGYRWVRGGGHLRMVEHRDTVGERWPIGDWELRRAPRPRDYTRRTV